MTLDNDFTLKMQQWMQREHSSAESIIEGAGILLALNRNRVLYGNIMANPTRPMWKEKLEYEINKFLKIRLDGMTRNDVIRLDQKVQRLTPAILAQGELPAHEGEATTSAQAQNGANAPSDVSPESINLKGKRKDHAQLPADIQYLWTSNASRWKKIAKLHATLCTMQNAPSCDRYEYLKVMDELEEQYRKNMEKYDNYQITADGNMVESQNQETENESAVNSEKTLQNTDSTEENDGNLTENDGNLTENTDSTASVSGNMLPENSEEAAKPSRNEADHDVSIARVKISRNKPKLIRLYKAAYDGTPLDQQNYEDFLVHVNAWVKTIITNHATMSDRLRNELRAYGVTIPEEDAK